MNSITPNTQLSSEHFPREQGYPRLSICIPTYNRAEFIGGCIDNILEQWQDGLELVIVDGASTDSTSEVVAEYLRRYPHFKYYRRSSNVGIDEDVLKVVELASGDYCWLMSDDDLLEEGAIASVLDRLSEFKNLSGASVSYSSYDKSMQFKIATIPAIIGMKPSSDQLFACGEECFAKLGMHLGYLSSQIVNRAVWNSAIAQSNLTPYMKSSWLMVYIIGQMLSIRPHWLYIHKECVKNRTANDSFVLKVGEFKRQLITHESFPQIVADLFGRNSDVFRKITNATIKSRMPRNLAKLKADNVPFLLQRDLLSLYTRKYGMYVKYWVWVFPIFLVPNFVMRIVRFVYFELQKHRSS